MFINFKRTPYIVAEIGINHNGFLSLAKKMIYESKRCGADAVKFQKRDISEMINFGKSPQLSTGYLSKNEKNWVGKNK